MTSEQKPTSEQPEPEPAAAPAVEPEPEQEPGPIFGDAGAGPEEPGEQ